MSRIKEYYHDEICEGIHKMNEKSDEDYQYELFKEEHLKLVNEKLEKRAEEEKFQRTFENTGTYPI